MATQVNIEVTTGYLYSLRRNHRWHYRWSRLGDMYLRCDMDWWDKPTYYQPTRRTHPQILHVYKTVKI